MTKLITGQKHSKPATLKLMFSQMFELLKFGLKQVEKGQISTVKR